MRAHQSPQQRSGLLPASSRFPQDCRRRGKKGALMMATALGLGSKRTNEQTSKLGPELIGRWRGRMALGGYRTYVDNVWLPMGAAATRVNYSARGPSRRAN